MVGEQVGSGLKRRSGRCGWKGLSLSPAPLFSLWFPVARPPCLGAANQGLTPLPTVSSNKPLLLYVVGVVHFVQ